MTSGFVRQAYLHALGVTVWARRVAPINASEDCPTGEPSIWTVLKPSERPRLSFVLAARPSEAEGALLERITRALGLTSDQVIWCQSGTGDRPSSDLLIPVIAFGVAIDVQGVPVVSAPRLIDLLDKPHTKAALWADLQARLVPLFV